MHDGWTRVYRVSLSDTRMQSIWEVKAESLAFNNEPPEIESKGINERSNNQNHTRCPFPKRESVGGALVEGGMDYQFGYRGWI